MANIDKITNFELEHFLEFLNRIPEYPKGFFWNNAYEGLEPQVIRQTYEKFRFIIKKKQIQFDVDFAFIRTLEGDNNGGFESMHNSIRTQKYKFQKLVDLYIQKRGMSPH